MSNSGDVSVTSNNTVLQSDPESLEKVENLKEEDLGVPLGNEIFVKKSIDNQLSQGNDGEIIEENDDDKSLFHRNTLEEIEICDQDEENEDEEPDLIEESSSTVPEKDLDANKTHSHSQKAFLMEESDNHLTEEDGWLDIFGTGDFKKRVIKPGDGNRVQAKNVVVVNYTTYKGDSDVVIEKVENFEFVVGDLDVVKGIDLAIPIMEHGEVAEILVPSRLAFGKIGRPPDIPPDCDLRYEVEILKVEELDECLAPAVAMKYGNQKRDRGNFWYGHNDYISAIHCYKRAAEFLDAIQDGSDCDSELLQEILDTKIKVYNNMAAAHMKMECYDQALKAVDFVLKTQSKNVKALFRKAKILSSKGLTDEAVVYLKKAAELEPDTKVIQQELQRVLRRRQVEQKNQKEMYKRMFPQQNSSNTRSSRLRKMARHWSIMAGSCVAIAAVSIAAYRQYFS